MNTPQEPDRNFHENLQRLGRSVPAPGGVSDDVRSRCTAQLRSSRSPSVRITAGSRRNRRLFPALGLAAAIALAVGLILPWQSARTVQAAEILAALDNQLAESSIIELTIDSLVVEEVSMSGHLQVGKNAAAGDIEIAVTEDPQQPPIRISASLGLSADGGWILLRELQVPDIQAQVILNFLIPPGAETLIVVPADMMNNSIGGDFDESLAALSSDGVKQFIEAVLDSASDVGATVEPQGDGTVRLTIPIDDLDAASGLLRTMVEAAKSAQGGDDDDLPTEEELNEIEISLHSDSDIEMLLGGTFEIIYDPDAGAVRSFSLYGIGDSEGSISIAVHGGDIDPALLDASRVTTPSTRTLDLSALKGLIGSMDLGNGELKLGVGTTISTEVEDE